ncbi:hypothetical protein TGPRC2_312075 [Toxoplasma gondii TgCatPRC2]|uniref:Uncharacterized protein n=2 Tax=Toxoplasma gondii TaxID=5811 RepID=A0A151HKQ4_TOXGO|nr:hypothetical protein TGMAS_312075 [Toxoplasma gondii MAS]KYK69880.1 hypothetical protein TGPRC2_312075 [Toxoplasma gondii TgCatPRC2]
MVVKVVSFREQTVLIPTKRGQGVRKSGPQERETAETASLRLHTPAHTCTRIRPDHTTDLLFLSKTAVRRWKCENYGSFSFLRSPLKGLFAVARRRTGGRNRQD